MRNARHGGCDEVRAADVLRMLKGCFDGPIDLKCLRDEEGTAA